MSKIKLLPSVLINKIAAGEVIERPASVVKELVENSIDAAATRVEVRIDEGGSRSVEVNDNGVGMSPEELRLAVQRHATSKLATPEDLFSIRSFGFRGEALPSIASVARLTIKSRSAGAESGYQIVIEGGELKSEGEIGCDFGTYISVHNLFFNTPARRKFLKTASAEVRRVVEVIESLAVGNPQCSFQLDSGGQQLLDVAATDNRVERAAQLFGISQRSKFMHASRDGELFRLEVYLSLPELCRRNRSRIMTLVNNRRIESKSLFAAITSSYGEFLNNGTYPQGVVYLDIDPTLVDVNVHPAKSEVRFSDERTLFHSLHHLIRESLLEGDSSRGLGRLPRSTNPMSTTEHFRQRTRDSLRSFFDSTAGSGQRAEESLAAIVARDDRSAKSHEDPHSDYSPPGEAQGDLETGRSALKSSIDSSVRLHQLAGLYIVAISYDSLMIIDQHAAHERVLFELALKSFHQESVTSQQLLFPVALQLEPSDLEVFEKEKDSLHSLGFEITAFGPRQVQIGAVPAALGSKNPEALFRELLDDFGDISGDEKKRFEKKAASFACRGAIMAGDRLSEPAMRALLMNLLAAENPYVCPHGRPTILKFTRTELDLKFGRLG